jgi:hypothetical protein
MTRMMQACFHSNRVLRRPLSAGLQRSHVRAADMAWCFLTVVNRSVRARHTSQAEFRRRAAVPVDSHDRLVLSPTVAPGRCSERNRIAASVLTGVINA